MPIPVACRCGKSFAANDNLAGKTVKCPACQQPLQIPAAGQAGAKTQAATPRPAAQAAPAGKIVVACRCGAKFAAGPELAGKQVKCPKCGQPLVVGAAQQAAPTPPQGAAPRPAAVRQPAAQTTATAATAGGGFGLDDLLDEVGVKQRASGDNACPACGAFLAPEAVLCIDCGYNRKTGKKIAVETMNKVEAKKLGPPSAAAKAAMAKQAAAAGNPYASPAAGSSSKAAYELTALDYLFVIFCGGIALIVALVYLIQGNPRGKALLIAWCIVQAVAFVIGMVLGLVLSVMQATSGGM